MQAFANLGSGSPASLIRGIPSLFPDRADQSAVRRVIPAQALGVSQETEKESGRRALSAMVFPTLQ